MKSGTHLKHGIGYFWQVAAQEAGVRFGNFNEQLQGLLSGTLIPGLQCVPDERQLPWDRCLELVTLSRILELLRATFTL